MMLALCALVRPQIASATSMCGPETRYRVFDLAAGARIGVRAPQARERIGVSRSRTTKTHQTYPLALWTSADPGFASFLGDTRAFEPQRGEQYSYSWNSPVWMHDPDGRDVWLDRVPATRISFGPLWNANANAQTYFAINSYRGNAMRASPERGYSIDYRFGLDQPEMRFLSTTSIDAHLDAFGRTDRSHEGFHEVAFRNYYTSENLNGVAVMAGLPMEAPRTADHAQVSREANMRAAAFVPFATELGNYMSNVAVHNVSGEGYGAVPSFTDPVTGRVWTPSANELDPVYQSVRRGIPTAPEHLPGYQAPSPSQPPASSARQE